ncbi:MAG TPA: DUF3568 domain-containing protein [Gemmatimonas aurantiaca]|uniref:DUF3568 domain-containing protein n=2 Tax=Gemmatimonas aurantiaca TaxID=173480 RepID=C1A4S2_GEMAT|nr:DUF3568 family protein [Gemmatimonas aurantiaca]BAH37232.1 hypothetical protein GAU_0190 [Gemmatimonas aurantiaca T-27]HCT55648.1 DUF3568 domain-containing protein [Gemmatimonas aurantiaca]
MPRFSRVFPVALLAAVTISSSGCFLVAAGAGAGAAIAYTQRGASASVPGSVDAVFGKAQSAFNAMSINETGQSTENSGATRRLVGKNGDNEITVEIKRSSDEVAAVEVVAKKNVVDYDKDLAKRVLDRIVGK